MSDYWKTHRLFDISANLVDKNYEGMYNNKKMHKPDLDRVI